MSGTSVGSVDYALCACRPDAIRLIRHWQVPFPATLETRVHAAARNEASTYELGQLHHDLGRFYARGAVRGLHGDQVDAVGLHGQTVFHHPDRARPATFQLGEPAWLTATLRVPVVSNFRAADLAAGGQGAPLATRFHQVAFARRGAFVCVNNLGGISNVTALDYREPAAPRVLAFDTGPANVLLDLAARHFSQGRRGFDRGGAWAARGSADETLLRAWLRHPYFRRRPPKSTGRELFGEPFWRLALAACTKSGLKREDALATLAEFTARSLVLNYRWHLRQPPDQVILAGGGAANPDLQRRITNRLRAWHAGIQVTDTRAFGWPLPTIEAAAFALLAAERLWRQPGNLPETTGARRAALLGQVSRP
jgi:anhydro-N-acetylmuramic acid kinase